MPVCGNDGGCAPAETAGGAPEARPARREMWRPLQTWPKGKGAWPKGEGAWPKGEGGSACKPSSRSDAEEAPIWSMLKMVEEKNALLAPRKEQLRRSIEDALANSSADSLRRCHLEVVGSTSWGGEVPQSDFDLMLYTPQGGTKGYEATAILRDLSGCLESRTHSGSRLWTFKLLETARVPILRIHDQGGLSCDIGVDRHNVLRHRDFMREALAGRPQVRNLIRLVKLWLHHRSLPLAAEGGVASFAWAVVALRLSETQPAGSSLADLLRHFFDEMKLLGEQMLFVPHSQDGGARWVWQWRTEASSWTHEWIPFFSVDDPTQPAPKACSAPEPRVLLTPPSIPAALAMLYVAELKIAWAAAHRQEWDVLWKPASTEVCRQLPTAAEDTRSQVTTLHMVLRSGMVQIGRLHAVRPCPYVAHEGSLLHRRDQNSELRLEPYCWGKNGNVTPLNTVLQFDDAMLVCNPCHWICALPVWNMKVFGDFFARLTEITKLAGRPAMGWMPVDPAMLWKPVPALPGSAKAPNFVQQQLTPAAPTFCVVCPFTVCGAVVAANVKPAGVSEGHHSQCGSGTSAPQKNARKLVNGKKGRQPHHKLPVGTRAPAEQRGLSAAGAPVVRALREGKGGKHASRSDDSSTRATDSDDESQRAEVGPAVYSKKVDVVTRFMGVSEPSSLMLEQFTGLSCALGGPDLFRPPPRHALHGGGARGYGGSVPGVAAAEGSPGTASTKPAGRSFADAVRAAPMKVGLQACVSGSMQASIEHPAAHLPDMPHGSEACSDKPAGAWGQSGRHSFADVVRGASMRSKAGTAGSTEDGDGPPGKVTVDPPQHVDAPPRASCEPAAAAQY